MSTTRVFTDPNAPYFKSDGVTVNSGGKLYFREPGTNTTTLKPVYADKNLTVPLINPVILDSSGRAPAIYLNGDYNVEHTDNLDVQIRRIDSYQPPAAEGQFDEWDASLTYGDNDYVKYSDGNYYVSLVAGNTGNVPSTSPNQWSQAFFITVYNSTVSYPEGEFIYYDGNLYTSLQNSNRGNTPDTSDTFWQKPGVSVPDIAGFTGNIVQYTKASTATSLNVITSISKALSVSIGPTGSGAQYIWTDLDILPDNAVSVYIGYESTITRTAGSSLAASIDCNVSSAGGTKLVKQLIYGSATEPGAASIVGQADQPIDSDNIFSIFWDSQSTDTETLTISLLGFSVAEV